MRGYLCLVTATVEIGLAVVGGLLVVRDGASLVSLEQVADLGEELLGGRSRFLRVDLT